jgi:hypothetical protein
VHLSNPRLLVEWLFGRLQVTQPAGGAWQAKTLEGFDKAVGDGDRLAADDGVADHD